MARAAVRVVVGLVVGVGAVVGAPAAGAAENEAGCLTQVAFWESTPPRPAGTAEPWSLWLWDRPDPDHLRRQCEDAGVEPRLRQPLWDGPAWGIPSLGSFV